MDTDINMDPDMDMDMDTDMDMGMDILYYWTGELYRFHMLIS